MNGLHYAYTEESQLNQFASECNDKKKKKTDARNEMKYIFDKMVTDEEIKNKIKPKIYLLIKFCKMKFYFFIINIV